LQGSWKNPNSDLRYRHRMLTPGETQQFFRRDKTR
jgi:hypothetical protein